jgi:3-dehydroquinate synthase
MLLVIVTNEGLSHFFHQNKDLIIEVVLQSCSDKADIVTQDELEAGKRVLLNLGHTFGHAIENTLGYGVYHN